MKVRFGMLMLAAVLVTGALVLRPPEAFAGCRCAGLGLSTTDCWGKGSTCAQAAANLPADCAMRADGNCGGEGACGVTVTSQGACWWNGMMYQVDGTASFGCIVCIERPPLEQ